MKSFPCQLFVAASAIACALVSPVSSRAQGIPVIDVANLIQAINAIAAWEQQYNQMQQQLIQQQQQLDSARQQVNALTGARGLGNYANNIQQSPVSPQFTAQLFATTTPTQAFDLVQQQLTAIQASSIARNSQIQQLMAAINDTQDAKAIAELTARIQAEQAMLTNEVREASTLRESLNVQLMQLQAKDAARISNAARQVPVPYKSQASQ